METQTPVPIAEKPAVPKRGALYANKVLKNLAGHAKEMGFNVLAEVFRDAFDPEVRNGYAHADYIVWKDGLRLPKRNGGRPKVIPWTEFDVIFQRGINFFHILREIVNEFVESYTPAKTIKARMSESAPEMNWKIYRDPETGALGIEGGLGL